MSEAKEPTLTDWERNFRRLHDLGLTDSDLEFCIRFMLKVKKLRENGVKQLIVHLDQDETAFKRVGRRETF